VLDAHPPQKGGGAPKFSAHVYCSQTSGWIKMVPGMDVGLSPGDLVVLDGDPAPSPKRGRAPCPIFGPFLLWPGCTKMPLGMELGLSPGDFVLDGDPLPKKGEEPSPPLNFQPMSIVAKRLDGSRWHLAWR